MYIWTDWIKTRKFSRLGENMWTNDPPKQEARVPALDRDGRWRRTDLCLSSAEEKVTRHSRPYTSSLAWWPSKRGKLYLYLQRNLTLQFREIYIPHILMQGRLVGEHNDTLHLHLCKSNFYPIKGHLKTPNPKQVVRPFENPKHWAGRWLPVSGKNLLRKKIMLSE
jgi:hypothetical protein